MTEDTGRVAPKAPPARLWWIMLVDAVALRRMARPLG